jgi:hypothetical protein
MLKLAFTVIPAMYILWILSGFSKIPNIAIYFFACILFVSESIKVNTLYLSAIFSVCLFLGLVFRPYTFLPEVTVNKNYSVFLFCVAYLSGLTGNLTALVLFLVAYGYAISTKKK